jgi:chorismate mutase/ribosomal protein S18 acetylase RimI-like enzyme
VTSTDPTAEAADVLLRPAEPGDAGAIVEVHLEARAAAPMPPSVHDADDILRWVTARTTDAEVWVAERAGSVVAYADLEHPTTGPGWLHSLYVRPAHARQGIGTLLLDLAKARRPGGFSLWVFESNTPAQAFYARHGLVELERTDGGTNEERRPDLRMAWPGEEPLEHFRARIDEVDADLARLLAHRFALTRAVQSFKPVGGHEGRDPEREAEIVRGMAARAPGVPESTWRTVVDAVITAGLDWEAGAGE